MKNILAYFHPRHQNSRNLITSRCVFFKRKHLQGGEVVENVPKLETSKLGVFTRLTCCISVKSADHRKYRTKLREAMFPLQFMIM